MKTAAVVLAGGMSRRMGRDKAALDFDGQTMLQRTVEKYAPLFDRIYVSLNQAGRFPTYGALELVDLRPGCGPMAGLESAFLSTDADLVFLTATDLPFSDPAMVPAMLAGCAGYDACMPDRNEPLYSVYARSALPVVQEMLDHDVRRLRTMIDRLRVNELSALSVGESLLNVNDPQVLQKALDRLENRT